MLIIPIMFCCNIRPDCLSSVIKENRLLSLTMLWLCSIHQIPSVPIVDCYQKIRQQVKCYLQMAGVMGKNELQEVSWNFLAFYLLT